MLITFAIDTHRNHANTSVLVGIQNSGILIETELTPRVECFRRELVL